MRCLISDATPVRRRIVDMRLFVSDELFCRENSALYKGGTAPFPGVLKSSRLNQNHARSIKLTNAVTAK